MNIGHKLTITELATLQKGQCPFCSWFAMEVGPWARVRRGRCTKCNTHFAFSQKEAEVIEPGGGLTPKVEPKEEQTMIVSEQDVLAAFAWSAPTEMDTKRGKRHLRRAPVSPEAMAYWQANKSALSAMGVTYGLKWKSQTAYEFCWWKELPKELVEARKANAELSRATDAVIDIPIPDGLSYLPYQKAGVQFILSVFGDNKV